MFANFKKELEIHYNRYKDKSNIYIHTMFSRNSKLFDRFIIMTMVREFEDGGYKVTIEDSEIIPFSEIPVHELPKILYPHKDKFYRYKIYNITRTREYYYRTVSEYKYRRFEF